MMLSRQSFPITTAKYLNKVFAEGRERRDLTSSNEFFDQQTEGMFKNLIP